MMNDDTLMTAVREPFAAVRMDIPVEQIVRRGRAVRARRRIPGLAGAAAAVAGGALAAAMLLPAGHPAGAQLAAYSVTKQPGGTIVVTINELRDPSGLQARLRADGVPARVTFITHGGLPDQSCRGYTNQMSPSQAHRLMQAAIQSDRRTRPLVLLIHPAALPRQAGLFIGFRNDVEPAHPNSFALEWTLVYASPACTG
jgi:hypothetical protein